MLQYRRYSVGDWYLKLYEDEIFECIKFFFYWREIEDFCGI